MEIENLLTPVFIWFAVGLIFLLLEFAIPGLILIFFGFGAWATSLVCLIFEPGIPLQLMIFLFSSVILLALFRRYLKKQFFKEGSDKDVSLESEFIGKHAIVEADIISGMHGKVVFKGTLWSAESDYDVKKGQKVEIIAKESIVLKVKPV